MRRVGWILAGALALGPITPVAADAVHAGQPAPAAYEKCRAGKGRLTINGERRCVRLGAVLPQAPAASSAWAGWSAALVEQRATDALDAALLPRRLEGRARPEVDQVLQALRRRMGHYGQVLDGASGITTSRTGAAREVVVTERAPVVTHTADAVPVSGSLDVTDSTTGLTATLGVAGTAQKDAAGRIDPALVGLELSLGVGRPGSSGYRVEVAVPPRGADDDVAERCPSAEGVVRRETSFGFRRTRQESHPTRTREYRNETLKVSGRVSMRGRVDDRAKLERVTFTARESFDLAIAASRHRPRIQAEVTGKIDVEITGSLDPETGRVVAASSSLRVRGRSSVVSDAEATEDLVADVGSAPVRAALEAALLRAVAHDHAALKAAERYWRTPNTCASLRLAPSTARLATGEKRSVNATVRASSSTRAAARLTLDHRVRGSVSGLPGDTTPSRAHRITITGGTPSGGLTADVTVRAVSPAGIATARWTGTEPPDDDLHYRVVSATASQTVTAGTREVSGCTWSVSDVGPWTYAFAATTGTPDGSVLTTTSGVAGSVRASGVSTRPAFALDFVCGGSTVTTPVDAISSTGRVGPQLGFFGDPGASSVTVTFGQITPAPILDVEGSGVDCTLQAGAAGGFTETVPLTTLRQATPFTLSHTTSWTKAAGSTSCTGVTTISMTLQRVNADGTSWSG